MYGQDTVGHNWTGARAKDRGRTERLIFLIMADRKDQPLVASFAVSSVVDVVVVVAIYKSPLCLGVKGKTKKNEEK